MSQYYYLPISAISFPEVVSAEAVSPTQGDVAGAFVGRTSSATVTSSSTIPINPNPNVLILYSEAVTWDYQEGRAMDYPYIIKVPEEILDRKSLIPLPLPSLPQNLSAWAYTRTIFFPSDGRVKYLFRSKQEMTDQLQRINLIQEVKSLDFIKDNCDLFSVPTDEVPKLPTTLANEINAAIATKGIHLTDQEADLGQEVHTGACLGYQIAKTPAYIGTPEAIRDVETILNEIRDSTAYEDAWKVLNGIYLNLQKLTEIFSKATPCDYTPHGISFKALFKYRGREAIQDWQSLEPLLSKCIDFIIQYPLTDWNWHGGEERGLFVKALWNNVLKSETERHQPFAVDALRNQVACICNHFRNPNATPLSLATETVQSDLLMALLITLESSGREDHLLTLLRNVPPGKVRTYAFTLYGALKGFAYIPRTLIPEHRKWKPSRISRENILEVVSRIRDKQESGTKSSKESWERIITAIDKAIDLREGCLSPTTAFLYILNNLISPTDALYRKLESALKVDTTPYDNRGLQARVRQLLRDWGYGIDEKTWPILLAVDLENMRHSPATFKYILDDCIRENITSKEEQRNARRLLRELDLDSLYGEKPSNLDLSIATAKKSKTTKAKSTTTKKTPTKRKSRKSSASTSQTASEPQQGQLLMD